MVEEFSLVICTVKARTIDVATLSGRMVARIIGSAARFGVEHSASVGVSATTLEWHLARAAAADADAEFAIQASNFGLSARSTKTGTV
jgi:hypothetical protein